ncbi:MAG: hypothetical protein DYG89_33375 [Caldilinea sp. CFX5]|nr:hypothetical protein [Caldilinea sp. CFX5]
MSQVTLPDKTVEKLEQVASTHGIDATALLLRLVDEYLASEPVDVTETSGATQDEQYRKIAQEQKVYEAQHQELLKVYRGQYIAMDQGRVVDHDVDGAALRRRIRAHYGSKAIFVTPVLEEPIQTIYVRSPRLVQNQPVQNRL